MNEELTSLIEQYRNKENYIISVDKNCKQTVIYFTSHGLYEKDDLELFRKNVIEKNKFEFYGTRIKNSKNIFVRDVLLNCYRDGINSNINSQEKLFEFLKEQVQDSEVITIGSSAGGYAALLYGNLLNAKKIFAFSPVVELGDEKCPLLNIIKDSKIPTYIMYPSEFESDVLTYEKIKNFSCISGVAIKSKFHGVPIYRSILEKLINSNDKKLKKIYSGELYSERLFVLKYFGLFEFFKRMIKKNFNITFNKK